MIPHRIFRTVPTDTNNEVERFWRTVAELHPGWETITYRDPIDPALFPITSPHWPQCTSGAQKAGLIRLEALLQHGGVYLDSDVELYRPLDPLLGVAAFAAWEDAKVVPDAVLGAKAAHPAIGQCLETAVAVLDQGAWASGPGVTTAILPGRTDVLLLPPAAFYPYHYTERHRRNDDHRSANPWAFGAHHWQFSWAATA